MTNSSMPEQPAGLDPFANADRTRIVVSEAAHAALLARLDKAPQPNDRLRKTMQTIPSWDEPVTYDAPFGVEPPRGRPE
jgi:hypothetical protein